MLYASDLFRSRCPGLVGLEELPEDLPDLIAEILVHAVAVRHRRQLSLGYQPRREVLNRVRGRIDLLTTERRNLLARGLVACSFDHLTIDTPRNRFVRAALETIARVVSRPELAHRCRALAGDLKTAGVSGQAPQTNEIKRERVGRHDHEDRFMIDAAILAFELALPNQSDGGRAIGHPEREEWWVRKLFERAVGGFYSVTLKPDEWQVRRGRTLNWPIIDKTMAIERILPSMKTDIVLDHVPTRQRLVIDTKFTSILTKGWYREESLKSGYVYQMYAYLRSQAGAGDPFADRASGLLLHPSAGDTVDEAVVIQGHQMRFATVDLTATAAAIRARLLQLCEPVASRSN